MYVPKIPRRLDFCGCPPCPLCFDWVEPAPPVEITKEIPIIPPVVEVRIDGIAKMAEEFGVKNPTTKQLRELRNAAEKIHERNLEQNTISPEDKGKADAQRRAEYFEGRAIEAAIKTKAKEKKKEPVPVDNRPTLDELTPEQLQEAMKPKVDESLIKREEKSKKATEEVLRKKKERELQQQREMQAMQEAAMRAWEDRYTGRKY